MFCWCSMRNLRSYLALAPPCNGTDATDRCHPFEKHATKEIFISKDLAMPTPLSDANQSAAEINNPRKTFVLALLEVQNCKIRSMRAVEEK
ncbi:hypothetical protein BS78_03G339700 [Paspalum vaginatum]|nr:hypothetical protein BS78_03G339700 [Paspalum vaginatum]